MEHLSVKTSRTRLQRFGEILVFPLNLLASAVELVFCIPWIGRLIKWLWNSLLTGLHFIFGMLEHLAWMVGFHPMKKLKVGVVVLSGPDQHPLADTEKILQALERTAEIFHSKARVQLVPAFRPTNARAHSKDPHLRWVQVAEYAESKQILDLGCNLQAIWEDLHLAGARIQLVSLRRMFATAFRRVSGYGAPVTILVVRRVGGIGGCSLGWFSDYVTIPPRGLRCIPHELGHALGLFHRNDPQNLLYPRDCSVSELTPWQVAVIRSSRHVTYF